MQGKQQEQDDGSRNDDGQSPVPRERRRLVLVCAVQAAFCPVTESAVFSWETLEIILCFLVGAGLLISILCNLVS